MREMLTAWPTSFRLPLAFGALMTLGLAFSAEAQNWPATGIHLVPLDGTGNSLAAGPAKAMAPAPGYDNQPFFTPDGKAVLFTSERASDQTEIFRYDLVTGEVQRLTDTWESEYSPTPLPGGGFSVVRVEPDGTQRLWRFDATGTKASLVLPNVPGVGYHAWGGKDQGRLALFILGEPPTLQIAEVAAGTAKMAVSDIGRALHPIPGRPAWSFVAPRDGRAWVQEISWETGEVRPVAPTLTADGDHDLAWMPDGTLLMAEGSVVHSWDGEAQSWRKVRDFAADGVEGITRLAVSPAGDQLALVVRETDPRRPLDRFIAGQTKFDKAREARDKSEWRSARHLLDEAAKLLPPQLGVERRRAGALARDGRPEEALRRLERIVSWQVESDFAADPDVATLARRPEWKGLLARQAKAAAPVAKAAVAFRAGEADFVPEGIAHDPQTGSFFLGSLRKGTILMVSATGEATPFAGVRAAGFGSVVGLTVDAPRRRLWAVAYDYFAADNFSLEGKLKTALCSFELDTGKALGCLEPPDGADGAHRLDDVAVAADGTVYVSDADAPAIYRARPGAERLEALTGAPEVQAPNGLAVSAKGDALYVADYTLGLLRVDLATGKATELRTPDRPLVGIDGLARYGDRALVAVQNGVDPDRILRIDLSPEGDGVVEVAVLELGRKDWDEPTLGTVVGEDYYYVSNSHWPRFNQDGTMTEGPPLTPPVVMKLTREQLAPR